MTEPTGPRADVLNERLIGLGKRFDRLERSVDGLATKAELTSIITARDELMTSQVVNLMEDVRGLTTLLEKERAERVAGDKENDTQSRARTDKLETRINGSRAIALSALGLFISTLLALIVLINQIGGTPS